MKVKYNGILFSSEEKMKFVGKWTELEIRLRYTRTRKTDVVCSHSCESLYQVFRFGDLCDEFGIPVESRQLKSNNWEVRERKKILRGGGTSRTQVT